MWFSRLSRDSTVQNRLSYYFLFSVETAELLSEPLTLSRRGANIENRSIVPPHSVTSLSGFDMLPLRQFTGWLALVIAIAGPLPLWAHHALCHTELCSAGCHSEQCHAHAGGEHGGHSHAGPSHVGGCGHDHQHPATSASDDSAGLSGITAEHDCFICYQLSQAASSAVVLSVECSSLPPIASSGAMGEFSIATLCGWHTPRGPPRG